MERIIIFVFFFFISTLAWAAKYPLPTDGDDIVGHNFTITAEPGETLDQIGEKYGLGYHEMAEANPQIYGNNLSGGEEILVPAQFVLPKYRKGIVINVAEVRLYYFTPDGKSVITYPVGLGRKDWRTPTAATSVIRKARNPSWNVPKKIRAQVFESTGSLLPGTVPPGPENPLGHYALYLGKQGYLIHGTNQPFSIGKFFGAGCIRLHNEDVKELYQYVKTGTSVHIVNHPYKVGWHQGKLFVEAHVPVNLPEPESDLNAISVIPVLKKAIKTNTQLDTYLLEQVVRDKRGVPQAIGYNGHRELGNQVNAEETPAVDVNESFDSTSALNYF